MSPTARNAGLALLVVAGVAGAFAPAAAQAPRAAAVRDTTRAVARDSAAARPLAPPDSLPGADARNVLRTIPEPLTPEEALVAPPDSFDVPPPEFAPPDPSAADTSGVPIPAETVPLGERRGAVGAGALADSLDAAGTAAGASGAPPDTAGLAPAPPAATPGSGTAPPGALPGSGSAPSRPAPAGSGGMASPPGAAARADTCWRLQVAAPTARPEAEAKRLAAESQLLVKFTIEVEQGRHKVRSLECLGRATGQSLRDRAALSGFEGAFLLRIGPDGRPIPMSSAPAKASGGSSRRTAPPARNRP